MAAFMGDVKQNARQKKSKQPLGQSEAWRGNELIGGRAMRTKSNEIKCDTHCEFHIFVLQARKSEHLFTWQELFKSGLKVLFSLLHY